MGSFANTVFSLLLGWLQTVTSVIWSALTGKNSESFLQFIGKNWILIAAVLCIAGVVIDFLVYLFRWEPYKVWKSFWKKIRNHPAETGEDEPAFPEEEDSSGQFPDIPDTAYDPGEHLQKRESLNGETAAAERNTAAGKAICQSDYETSETEETERQEMPDFTQQMRTSRRRRRFNHLLGDPDEEQPHYFTPKPMVDQKEAYHHPVYPENWKGNGEREK